MISVSWWTQGSTVSGRVGTQRRVGTFSERIVHLLPLRSAASRGVSVLGVLGANKMQGSLANLQLA